MDWLDLLAVQGSLKSLLQHHSSKASILRHSAFFMVQLSQPYVTTGKNIALMIRTFVDKVMSLLFNTLFRFVIAFMSRSNHLLISWLQHMNFGLSPPLHWPASSKSTPTEYTLNISKHTFFSIILHTDKCNGSCNIFFSHPIDSLCASFYFYTNTTLVVVVVQWLSCVQLFEIPCTAACQASLPFTISWSLSKFMSIELVMLTTYLILHLPLFLLPSISPSISLPLGFSNLIFSFLITISLLSCLPDQSCCEAIFWGSRGIQRVWCREMTYGEWP